MKKLYCTLMVLLSSLGLLSLFLFFSSCGSWKYSRHVGEVTALTVIPGEPIDTIRLVKQTTYYEKGARRDRGPLIDPTAFGSTAMGLVASGVKNAINKEQQKYQAQYEFNVGSDKTKRVGNDTLYFYKYKSTSGPLDLTGMQFYRFSLTRLVGKKPKQEIAMSAVFELDTTNLCEIMYDGVFHLRLMGLTLNYVKAKMPKRRKKVNLDLQIQFLSSYVTKDGRLNNNVVLGTFTKNLSNLTVQEPDLYDSLKENNKTMDGWSFVVPRSYFSRNDSDMWNKGAYSIKATVKETSKQKYLSKIAAGQAGSLIDAANKSIIFDNLLQPAKSTTGKK